MVMPAPPRELRIGTRGSQLALWQANTVAARIVETGGPSCRIVTIRTSGDRLQEAPLAEVGGKRLFVKEIEDALLRGDIDLAVHSSKDMPAILPEGLTIAAVLPREDPLDVIVLASTVRLKADTTCASGSAARGSIERGSAERGSAERGSIDDRSPSHVVSGFPPSPGFGETRRSAERGGGSRPVAHVASASRQTGATDAIDQVVATYFPAPASYTGDDVVEISAHGSPVVLRAIVAGAIASGARLAEPGEFTLRAFLNGRIDLTQAEAIGDLIEAATPLQARAAFDQLQGTLTEIIGEIDRALFALVARLEASIDFPEEGYHFVEAGTLASALDVLIERTDRLLADGARGRIIREGLQVAIVGKPNVGKSSIFNALVGTSRAIVTDVPGTTRDLLTEVIDLDGLRLTLVDTAGVRETTDRIETEGVRRALQAQQVSDLLLVVLDGSEPLDDQDRDVISQTSDSKRLIVQNKSDIEPAWNQPAALRVAATRGDGIPQLREAICTALDVEPLSDRPEITNVRHIALVQRARTSMVRAREAAAGISLSEEFVLADLQDARAALEEISGRRVSDDLLEHIFSKFCIGK
jgi:tRNA modification GTPase